MAEILHLKSWNTSDVNSNKIKMVSKYTDLGSPDSKKSLLGFIFNMSIPRESTATAHSTFHITVEARTGLNNPFRLEIVEMFKSPIRDIQFVQLRISGRGARDFGINDIGLIFRKYRTDSTVTSLDEE